MNKIILNELNKEFKNNIEFSINNNIIKIEKVNKNYCKTLKEYEIEHDLKYAKKHNFNNYINRFMNEWNNNKANTIIKDNVLDKIKEIVFKYNGNCNFNNSVVII